jgi:hypothetical protein
MNRCDEIAPAQLEAWKAFYAASGQRVFWTNGRNGDGTKAVRKELLKVRQNWPGVRPRLLSEGGA